MNAEVGMCSRREGITTGKDTDIDKSTLRDPRTVECPYPKAFPLNGRFLVAQGHAPSLLFPPVDDAF